MQTIVPLILALLVAVFPAWGMILRPSGADSTSCRHCDCGGSGCCAQPATPDPGRFPGTPLPSPRNDTITEALVPATQVFRLEAPSDSFPRPPSPPLTAATTPPLFRRFCAVLI